jgi:hypothetical protein
MNSIYQFYLKKKDSILVTAFYFLSHFGLVLISSSVYWDDWTLYNTSPELIFQTFDQAGTILNWASYFHTFLLGFGPYTYRIITFFSYLLSSLLVFRILKEQLNIKPQDAFVISLLFTVLPFNSARISLIVVPYAICYVCFFIAWYLIFKNRLLSTLLFFLSFNTNSLLVFYTLPMLTTLNLELKTQNFKEIAKWAMKRLDFLLIPFIFWFIKKAYYAPTKLYSGYNQNFSIGNLLKAFSELCLDFTNFNVPVLLCILAFIALRSMPFEIETKVKINKFYLRLGIISTICALFPYLILGHPPTFSEWTSRHQLLLPFGISLLIWVFIKKLSSLNAEILFKLIISASIAYNISQYSAAIIDWRKQKELIRLIRSSDEIKNSNLIVFEDLTKTHNAFNRSYRFYEWSGLLKKSFADETRLGISYTDIKEVKNGNYLKIKSEAFNFRDFDEKQIKEAVVTIRFRSKLGLINRLLPILGDGRLYQIDVSPPHFFESTSK